MRCWELEDELMSIIGPNYGRVPTPPTLSLQDRATLCLEIIEGTDRGSMQNTAHTFVTFRAYVRFDGNNSEDTVLGFDDQRYSASYIYKLAHPMIDQCLSGASKETANGRVLHIRRIAPYDMPLPDEGKTEYRFGGVYEAHIKENLVE